MEEAMEDGPVLHQDEAEKMGEVGAMIHEDDDSESDGEPEEE